MRGPAARCLRAASVPLIIGVGPRRRQRRRRPAGTFLPERGRKMDTKKIKVEKILKKLPEKSGTGKKGEYTIYKVLASVSGQEEAVTISSFSPIEIQPGSEIEVFEKEFKGEIEFEITKRSANADKRQGAGGGNWGGGGRGYGKPSCTIPELDAIFAHAIAEMKKYFTPE